MNKIFFFFFWELSEVKIKQLIHKIKVQQQLLAADLLAKWSWILFSSCWAKPSAKYKFA